MSRMFHRVARHRRLFCFTITALIVAQFFGAFTHLFEVDYYSKFSYPLVVDIKPCVKSLQTRLALPKDCEIINSYNYSFLSNCAVKCESSGSSLLRLVYIVKSKLDNFDRREAIRKTWGFEKRFSDVPIRTVFLLGVEATDSGLQRTVEEESRKYRDIVQADFIDTYFNNTIKTMMGMKWAMTYCKNSKFYFFSDDDMYVSTKNVLRFVRNPLNYPDYLESPIISLQKTFEKRQLMSSSKHHRKLNQVLDFELSDDVKLLAGYVFFSGPQRHYSSKWYTTLEEYPFSKFPPYVSAGSYVVSFNALSDLYFASFFTKHFRFDDVYVGLLAKKMDIEPCHCDEFHFYKISYNRFNYRYVISSHGYDDPNELLEVWNEQKSAGNA